MKGNYYFTVQGWMLQNLNLSGNELNIYAIIHGFCQDGQSFFYGGFDYLSEMANISKPSVNACMKKLLEKGHIIRIEVSEYRIGNKVVKSRGGSNHLYIYYTLASRQPELTIIKDEDDFLYKEKLSNNNCETFEPIIETQITNEVIQNRQMSVEKNSELSFYDEPSKESLRTELSFYGEPSKESLPNNNTIYKYKSSSKNEPDEKAQIKENSEEDFLQNTLDEVYKAKAGHTTHFEPNPVPSLLKNLKEVGIEKENWKAYLEFAFTTLLKTCKNKMDFDGYFYKSFCSFTLLYKFLETKQITKPVIKYINCPICGTKHDELDLYCPNSLCHFGKTDLHNEKIICLERKLYRMNPSTKRNYEAEISALDVKYPILERIKNKNILDSYEMDMHKINEKYEIS